MTGWSSIAGRSGGGSEGVSDSGSVLLCGSGSGSGRLQRWLVSPLGGGISVLCVAPGRVGCVGLS